MTWHPQLIFWSLILLAPFLLWLLASLALRGRLGELYLRRFENPRRERLFLSAVSFLIAFSSARSVAHAIHREAIGFRGVFVGTTHVHHLVFGILILSVCGEAPFFIHCSGWCSAEDAPRLRRIRNTNDLGEFWASEAMTDEVKENLKPSVIEPLAPMAFDGEGNLF